MSNSVLDILEAKAPDAANTFAALGDATRLGLVTRLSDGSRCSIGELSRESPLTRQAITKHLRVLEEAGIVSSRKSGRQSLYALNTRNLHDATAYIEVISRQWDQALSRLKALVEE